MPRAITTHYESRVGTSYGSIKIIDVVKRNRHTMFSCRCANGHAFLCEAWQFLKAWRNHESRKCPICHPRQGRIALSDAAAANDGSALGHDFVDERRETRSGVETVRVCRRCSMESTWPGAQNPCGTPVVIVRRATEAA